MRKLLIIGLLLSACAGIAQNQLGLHQGNYNGATGIVKNPASFQISSLSWDFVLVSGGTFVENDYAYIKDATIPKIIFGDNTFVESGELINSDVNTLEYDFFNANQSMYNTVNAFAGYPSYVGRVNRTVSVGLFARTRVGFAANEVDQFWSYPKLDQWTYGETRVSDPIWVGGIMWSEVGLNLAKAFKLGQNPLAIGINLKYLAGHESVYGFVPNSTVVTLYQPHYLAYTPEAYYGFTDFENSFFEPALKGNGFGVDIGLVYQHKQPDGSTKWQASLSLVDFGAIRFTEAQHHHTTTENVSVLSRPAMAQIQSLNDFASIVSNEVMGSPTASRVGSTYNMITPAALIVSLEYRVTEKWIIESEVGRRAVLSPRQLYRENYITLSGRYETPWFEVGMPLVLYNDQDFRMGTWVRFGPVVIGSDHVTTWFMNQAQLTGTDFYFAIRLNEFSFGGGGKTGRNRKSSDPEDCYW